MVEVVLLELEEMEQINLPDQEVQQEVLVELVQQQVLQDHL